MFVHDNRRVILGKWEPQRVFVKFYTDKSRGLAPPRKATEPKTDAINPNLRQPASLTDRNCGLVQCLADIYPLLLSCTCRLVTLEPCMPQRSGNFLTFFLSEKLAM